MYKNKNDFQFNFTNWTRFFSCLYLVLFFFAFLVAVISGIKANHDDNNDTNWNENFVSLAVCVSVSGFSSILVAVISVLKQIYPQKPKSIDDDNVREMTQNTSVIYNADAVSVG